MAVRGCGSRSATRSPRPKRHPERQTTSFPLKNKIAVACAKLLNKVISKSKALEDKSRSEKSSPEGDDPKRPITINIGGTPIRTDREGCVLAQNLTSEGGEHKTVHEN